MKSNIRQLVYGALCVALSFALSFVKLFSMPMGGSVTLCSMLPLMLYAYRYGLKSGLLAGLAYGLLQLVQKPEIVHWSQMLLDYPAAFAALGLAGLWKLPDRVDENGLVRGPDPDAPSHYWRLPCAILTGGVGRLLFHVITGAVFFGAYAPAGQNAWMYSLLYNGGYLGADVALCVVVALATSLHKLFLRATQD